MMGSPPSEIGPYRVVRKLGEGGMGAVYEAVHKTISRRVAIKVLLPEAGRSPEAINRFINEARAANLIDHPGLVQITDFGNLPDGSGYLVMERLRGETLADRLEASGGKLAPEEAVQIGIQIASALHACHKKGVVHRDLKPGNTMLVPDPATATGERLKVLDFGLAKLIEVREAAFVKTNSQAVFGTPLYMSPEQCEGAGRVDAKTDVYALGCMLYEMLTGQPPFSGDGPGQVLGKHMFKEPESLATLAPQLPAALPDLVHRLLAKSKDERPTMRDTQQALEALAPSLPPPRRREAELPETISTDNLAAIGLAPTLAEEAAESHRMRSDEMEFASTLHANAKQPSPLRMAPGQAAVRPSRRVVLLAAALACVLVIAGVIGLRLTAPKARPELPPAPVPPTAIPPPQKTAQPAPLPQKPEPAPLLQKPESEPKKKPAAQDVGGAAKRQAQKKPLHGRIFED